MIARPPASLEDDTFPEMGGAARAQDLWFYTDKADGIFERAIAAGAKQVSPMSDMFWGERTGTLTGKWGNRWTIGRRVKNLSPEEVQAAQDEAVARMKR